MRQDSRVPFVFLYCPEKRNQRRNWNNHGYMYFVLPLLSNSDLLLLYEDISNPHHLFYNKINDNTTLLDGLDNYLHLRGFCRVVNARVMDITATDTSTGSNAKMNNSQPGAIVSNVAVSVLTSPPTATTHTIPKAATA